MAITQDISQEKTIIPTLDTWLHGSGGTKAQITQTVYDLPYAPPLSGFITQQNLRNRVSYAATGTLATDAGFTSATYYSYDIHGNVDVLLQDYNGIAAMKLNDPFINQANRYKKITYDYDLISGKVNQVNYQPGFENAFYHRYTYDAENRITAAETSRDMIVWERDAAYEYYKHGPLARTRLGQLHVQGMNYAYTLQGWLKGVNSTARSGADGRACATGTANDKLDINIRPVFGQPLQYVAKSEINFLDGLKAPPAMCLRHLLILPPLPATLLPTPPKFMHRAIWAATAPPPETRW